MKNNIYIFLLLLSFGNLFAQKNMSNKNEGITHSITQQKDIDEVEQYYKQKEYKKVIKLLTTKDEEGKLTLRELFLLTDSYGRNRQYPNGLVYANKMIDECVKQKDTFNLLKAYNLKANNLIDLRQMKKGIDFCESVAPIFIKKDSLEFQKLCFKWGMMYYHVGNYKKAHEIYNNITHKEYRDLSLFTNNYALTLEGLGRIDEAILYLKKGLKIRRSENKDITISYSNIGQMYAELNKWKNAKKYLDSAENAITKNTSLQYQKAIYEQFYNYYQLRKETFEAGIYLEYINDLNNQIFNKKLNEEIEALKTSYARETLLNEKLTNSKKEKLWGTIILLMIILLLLSVLFLFKYKNVKSAHETVLTEQRLLRSQMTPHFIFNSLSVLQGMILNNEDKKAVSYLSKFSKLLRLILENSREKIVPLQEELEAIKNYIDLHNMRNENSIKYTLTLGENVIPSELMIPPMLIQPFIENSIKHGFKNEYSNAVISVDIKFVDEKLECIIKDNGVGIDSHKITSKTKKSLSTTITSERLKLFSKEYKVASGVTIVDRSRYNEQGTQINLLLPYKLEQDA